MPSLRRRLSWILLGLVLFSWLASAVVTAYFSNRALISQVDRQLLQYADLVNYITRVFERQLEAGVAVGEPWLRLDASGELAAPLVVDNSTANGGVHTPALNIWSDKTLLAVLADSPRFSRPQRQGFRTRSLPGTTTPWRLYARYDKPSGLWIEVGIKLSEARWSLLASLGPALLPLLIVLPLTLLVLFLGIDRGLAPLTAFARQLERRSPQQLEPVPGRAVPRELAPVIDALNDLLRRLAQAMESENRFTANAAHELITPLAAIKAEVQLCQRQLAGEGAQARLEGVVARVDRAQHAVEQLLTLARLDPENPVPMVQVDLAASLREALADTAHLALERDLELDLEAPERCEVRGHSEALGILLRNLLVNAFRYASSASRLSIVLCREEHRVRLVITNVCEPLPEEASRRLAERFYRLPGSRGAGVGLGLSIVERVATQHGGDFRAGRGATSREFVAELSLPPGVEPDSAPAGL